MDSLIALLILANGAVMATAAFAWIVEKKPQPNTYRLAMIAFLVYSLGFFLLLFFSNKPQPISLMAIMVVLSAGTAIAAIWVWKKYREAYPNTVS